ncbi:MAG: penicillin-binding protein activator LpoB [Kiritimatiellaeota bacterium]|nr:penicillin-binding protein activator LpoB [Kiritimatiellota bacterium]
MKHTHTLIIGLGAVALMGGCATAPTRITAGGTQAITSMGVDLADFRATAGAMVGQLLVNPAITRFEAENGRLPVIDVGRVVNKSDMNIDISQITGRINEDLLNSGQVELVANDAGARNASALDNFENDVKNATEDRADFYLEGEILFLAARNGSLREKTYSFMMRLNNRSRRTVWQRTEDVAKQGTRSNVSW